MKSVFKIWYAWYEGEEESVWLGKDFGDVNKEEADGLFEKELKEVYSLLKRGVSTPDLFDNVIGGMIEKGYALTCLDNDLVYDIDEEGITRIKEIKERKKL